MGLGEASARPGNSGSLAGALAVPIDNCEGAWGRRAAERANKTVTWNEAETFMTIPSKESKFSAGAGKVKIRLVLCGNSVSHPFSALGDARTLDAGQPAAP